MFNFNRLFRTLLAGLIGLVAVSGTVQAQSKLAEIVEAGVVHVGMAEFKPFVYKDTQTDELVGFEVDVANELAKALGVELQIMEATWETIFAGLHTGKYDIVMSGSKRTLQRALAVTFAEPYVSLTEYAMIKKDAGINTWQDLDKEGNTVCSVLGGAAHLKLKDEGLVEHATLTPFKNLTLCGNSVLGGQATGWIEDVVSISTFMKAHEGADLEVLELPFVAHGEGNGYAIEKGNQEWLNWLNLFVTKLKNDGTYARLAEKYGLPENIIVKGWGQQ